MLAAVLWMGITVMDNENHAEPVEDEGKTPAIRKMYIASCLCRLFNVKVSVRVLDRLQVGLVGNFSRLL